ncbi:hypothetical protein FCM35_KLT15364 [Carex littledalei]|uniref:Uncharacterized protein n=1 Tax=Carex littledalei TaxID=544730 RepID=A0A833RR11_9POAL|nr:hypothetical protein FCM35_KLT15364 [Carex littledalei]
MGYKLDKFCNIDYCSWNPADWILQELKMKVEGGEGSSRASRIFSRASSFVGDIINGKSNTAKDVLVKKFI